MVTSVLEVTLVIDVTSKVIEDPLDSTRVREDGNPILKTERESKLNRFDPSPVPAYRWAPAQRIGSRSPCNHPGKNGPSSDHNRSQERSEGRRGRGEQ